MVNIIFENIFKKWIFREKQFDKVKTQYVQDASTARYHQLHGKNFKVILIRIIINKH